MGIIVTSNQRRTATTLSGDEAAANQRRLLRAAALLLAVCALAAVGGCSAGKPSYCYCSNEGMQPYHGMATKLEEPKLDCECPGYLDTFGAAPPLTIDSQPPHYLDLPLEACVRLALQNSQVIRRLGVSVLDFPRNATTRLDSAVQETNPAPGISELRDIGVEAALADFDAKFAASAFFEKNDRALNNIFLGGGTRLFQQDLAVFQKQLSKKAATGTNFALRQTTTYDANNSPGNAFPSAWDTIVEAEFRHPLLRGGGVAFNRINGNADIGGIPNGVLIARVAGDIKLADIEIGVRDMVRDVERAYWALYFAYRHLDAAVAARNSSLETWRRIHALYLAGRRGGEAEKEAQAREQYFRFQEQVQIALSGGGDDPDHVVGERQARGVQEKERQLRYLIGLPINDGCLIRPADEPPLAKVCFDWDEVLIEALARRQELRKQKWEIKRAELELIAAKNFLLPQLDLTGKYRWRGFGDDLLDPRREGKPPFDNAYNELTGGEFQEWTLAAELNVPLGQRHAHAKVRNVELRLCRERAILHEQERRVVHDLSDAIARSQQTYAILQTNFNRRQSARQYLQSVEAAYHSDNAPLDLVLEAQRRVSEAETRYFASLAEYARAVTQVHFAKGSLLDYNEVYLAEGPWPGKAYHDAARRDQLRTSPLGVDDYTLRRAKLVSAGEVPQQIEPPGEIIHETSSPSNFAAPPLPGELVPPGQVAPPGGKVQRLPEPK
jgi:outer membrane protein TolC